MIRLFIHISQAKVEFEALQPGFEKDLEDFLFQSLCPILGRLIVN